MATKSVRLRPFSVPNFVLVEAAPTSRSEGFCETPKFPLADLEAATLAELCDEFRAAVFAKAGKADPRKAPSAKEK